MQSKKYENIKGSDLANGTLAVFFFLANGSCATNKKTRGKLLQGIAIPQTGIAAPTLTAMQGFKAKKKYPHRIFLKST